MLPASNQTCRYSQRIVELNLRIGQCVSDLTLHLQLHGIESGAGGMQRLQDAVDALRLATPSTSSAHSSQALEAECSVDRGALCIDMDFSGQRKVLCSLNDALIMFGRYEGQPVLVMEASAAAVHCIRAQQQQGTGPSLPRLLRDLTNVVHPNIVEVKGGYIAQPPAAPLTLVLEPFDQLLPAALRCPCSGTQKLAASVDICRGLSFLQSISRRFLLVPERVAVSSAFTCKLLLNVAGDAALSRWSPPEHADAAWDGLSSPAAAMFSFGLVLMHMWGEEGGRLGPFPLKDQDEIRSCASRRSSFPIHSPGVAGLRCSACSWGSHTLSSRTWPRCRTCRRCKMLPYLGE